MFPFSQDLGRRREGSAKYVNRSRTYIPSVTNVVSTRVSYCGVFLDFVHEQTAAVNVMISEQSM